MVARLMTVVCVRTKSSAVSVSSFPGLAGRDNAPSRPSGLPVLKKKVAAHAGVASHTPTLNVVAIKLIRNLMAILLVLSSQFKLSTSSAGHPAAYAPAFRIAGGPTSTGHFSKLSKI
jgi:hypothetical protein